ncbi:MAG: vWA domain-containing protein, partial [Gemmatimonadaceae bacterium]
MARRTTRLLAILIALTVVFYSRAGFSRREQREESFAAADTTDQGRYKPTVQEGLGASVAILLDQSGSMKDTPDSGGETPKYVIARQAIQQVLAQTDSFVAQQTGFPINVGLYIFDSDVRNVLPIAPYNRDSLRAALEALPEPSGSTAIGDAMEQATHDLYGAGTIRKYLLVVTDGENTTGRKPERVAREVDRRSEGAVKLYLVAFDVDAAKFGFVNEVRGTVLEAHNAVALRASLDTLYRGRILAEAVDAGETQPVR